MNLLQISHEVVMNFTRIHESQSRISRTSQEFQNIKKNSQSHNQPLACHPRAAVDLLLACPPRAAWRPGKAPSRCLEAGEAPSRRLATGEGPLAPPGGRGSSPCATVCSLEAEEGPLAPPSAPWWPAAAGEEGPAHRQPRSVGGPPCWRWPAASTPPACRRRQGKASAPPPRRPPPLAPALCPDGPRSPAPAPSMAGSRPKVDREERRVGGRS